MHPEAGTLLDTKESATETEPGVNSQKHRSKSKYQTQNATSSVTALRSFGKRVTTGTESADQRLAGVGSGVGTDHEGAPGNLGRR